jgi:hypothetical protein
MTVHNTFDLSIPTHISCALYEKNEIDSLIISLIKKDCKNYAVDSVDVYSVSPESLLKAFQKSKIIKDIVVEIDKTINTSDFKPNSVYFLNNIIAKLTNLRLITFVFLKDVDFTRILKTDIKNLGLFNYTIIEGNFDLTKIFDRKSLDIFNRNLIQMNILPSKYMERRPYVYMKTDVLFDIIDVMNSNGLLKEFDLFNYIDPKLEKDDPMLLIKTDYSIY